MGVEEQSQDISDHRSVSGCPLCCVYWCREPAAIIVQLNDKPLGCCRIHAAFIKAGKMDWFER